jgi:hypothetical protein
MEPLTPDAFTKKLMKASDIIDTIYFLTLTSAQIYILCRLKTRFDTLGRVTMILFFLITLIRSADTFIHDYLVVLELRRWGRTLVTLVEYFFVYSMVRVY